MHFDVLRAITDTELCNSLWSMYDESCNSTRHLSPTRQFLYEDEFRNHLKADDVIKILMIEDGAIIGILMFTSNLTHCGWLNPYFFERAKKEFTGGKPIYYNIIMAVKKSHQGGGVNKQMLRYGYNYVFSLGGVGCVDFSEKTTPGGEKWAEYMAQYVRADIEIYDSQHYVIGKPKS